MPSVRSAAPPASAADASAPRPSAAERRAQILEAARDVCLAHGIAAARMDGIAARARVSKGTLYNHFASREDLLLAMMEEQLQLGSDVVAAAVAGGVAPEVSFARMLEGLVELVSLQAASAPLLYQTFSLVGDDAVLRDRLYSALRRFFAEWEAGTCDVLRAGQNSGAFRGDADAAAFTETLVALVSGLIFRGSFDPTRLGAESLRASFRVLVAEHLLDPTPAPSGDLR
jgi:AcrR family transcriptional regulator